MTERITRCDVCGAVSHGVEDEWWMWGKCYCGVCADKILAYAESLKPKGAWVVRTNGSEYTLSRPSNASRYGLGAAEVFRLEASAASALYKYMRGEHGPVDERD